MKTKIISAEEARKRLVAPEDMVSCSVAFIDCKLPGSHLKQNYSFIGPGVTQSSSQVVNIPEPHGFNIGAAAMSYPIILMMMSAIPLSVIHCALSASALSNSGSIKKYIISSS